MTELPDYKISLVEYWNSFVSGAMRRREDARACEEDEGVGKNGQKERSHKSHITKRDKVNCQNEQRQDK